MKTIILFFLSAISMAGKAQKQVELFDLFTRLSQPTTVKAHMQNWNTGSSINEVVKWQNASPVAAGQMFYRNGKLKGTIAGKAFTCIDEIINKKSECSWTLSLNGKKSGYTLFSIWTSNFPIHDQKKAIEMLFPSNQRAFTLINHCMEGASFWSSLYRVNLAGRKLGWMIIQFESMSATASQYESSGVANNFSITYYYDQAEAGKMCN